MFSKTLKAGVLLSILGLISLLIERVFYGHLNADGVLQESFFLPLGVFMLAGGIVLSVIGMILCLLKRSQ